MTRERSEHEIIATMLRKIILRPAEKGSSTLMNERRVERLHPLPMSGGAWGG